jgi:hypothetical protein
VRVPAFDELTALGCAKLAGGRDRDRLEAATLVAPDGAGPQRRARFRRALERSLGWRGATAADGG